MPVVPATLRLDGRTLVGSGPGRAPGSHVYFDHTEGRTYELYVAQVEHTEAGYTLAALIGHPAVRVVRVGQGHVPPGDRLMVGPLQFDTAGMAHARHAWRLDDLPLTGVVKFLHRDGYGFIAVPGGDDRFFHVSDLRPGVVPYVGLPVRFCPYFGKGPAARDVRPA
jgi:cold shock CspA family protein